MVDSAQPDSVAVPALQSKNWHPENLRSEFLQIMVRRGFLHQATDLQGLDAILADSEPVSAYIGFDCTANSLHVGHLMSLMVLRWFQKTGHTPIVLIGGGTTKIGDPSGKDETRKLLSEDQIASNIEGIHHCFKAYLDFNASTSYQNKAILANNAEWLDALYYIPLLRDIGRHFSINRMLHQDSVRLRLEREQPLSFLEFNYMILQAYDFVELGRRYACRLQMGGSDQWGNIIMGADLCRRLDQRIAFGLTTPLLTTASGAKMGKTSSGAVWLNSDRLPVFDFWQYWRNSDDADVGRFLKLFTELPLDEIARLEQLEGAEINEAKKILATEVTALRHGTEAAELAQHTAAETFEKGGVGEGLANLVLSHAELSAGIALFPLFTRAGLTQSNGEARRLIKGGGARLNDQPIYEEKQQITLVDLDPSGIAKLSAGRKKHVLLRIE